MLVRAHFKVIPSSHDAPTSDPTFDAVIPNSDRDPGSLEGAITSSEEVPTHDFIDTEESEIIDLM